MRKSALKGRVVDNELIVGRDLPACRDAQHVLEVLRPPCTLLLQGALTCGAGIGAVELRPDLSGEHQMAPPSMPFCLQPGTQLPPTAAEQRRSSVMLSLE
eukprot:CAMPEP_0115866582 /NCGR_PEP_ID=MMETSP0287-20121206/20324_1 /TAXON_ID=412157 /ORGANISM="Chrysochromulina rotalis, Strain UIO044" /LENGTH=99 /DNA_ID=CAMNT_0003321155 /DNA_START=557 /DNA_END=857 /DNA_ORIENTATION=-